MMRESGLCNNNGATVKFRPAAALPPSPLNLLLGNNSGLHVLAVSSSSLGLLFGQTCCKSGEVSRNLLNLLLTTLLLYCSKALLLYCSTALLRYSCICCCCVVHYLLLIGLLECKLGE